MANHKQQMQDPMTGQVGVGQSIYTLCGVGLLWIQQDKPCYRRVAGINHLWA